MKVLVDTNVISELRKGEKGHPQVVAWARSLAPEDVATSVVVLAEIRRGIELKRLKDKRLAEALDAWYETLREGLGARVLPVDERVADAWARMSVPDPVPIVDGLIAATALVNGLALATRNVADVRRTGVSVVDPFAFAGT